MYKSRVPGRWQAWVTERHLLSLRPQSESTDSAQQECPGSECPMAQSALCSTQDNSHSPASKQAARSYAAVGSARDSSFQVHPLPTTGPCFSGPWSSSENACTGMAQWCSAPLRCISTGSCSQFHGYPRLTPSTSQPQMTECMVPRSLVTNLVDGVCWLLNAAEFSVDCLPSQPGLLFVSPPCSPPSSMPVLPPPTSPGPSQCNVAVPPAPYQQALSFLHGHIQGTR